jgi:hypothetical protein
MISPKEEAAECRRQAAMCLELAAQMSAHPDRDHMLALARRWTELAEKAEARAAEDSALAAFCPAPDLETIPDVGGVVRALPSRRGYNVERRWAPRGDEPGVKQACAGLELTGSTPVIELVAVSILDLTPAGEFDPDRPIEATVSTFEG